ncbi:hypothetical protein ABFV83_17120 [Lacrimispora sp. BS-2]|uniref:Amylopullulanase X25 domain-containing protein n=1 Tax=Lacrimispora sp. BS-2 TaxID=3151850 RepID=A0AAU7PME8_9FIRM
MDFVFYEKISREVLENYLSRCVTAAGLFESETLTDDLRAIKEMGVKFLGRASGIWYMPMEDEEHFRLSRELAEKVHAVDPDIILQACVFEWIVERMEEIRIPAYVFKAFGMKPEERTFRMQEALFTDESSGYISRRQDPSKNGGIPDLSRREAQMWFYYRATRYIDCGYEALHMGQVHLYTAHDPGMEKTAQLFTMIREYARVHGRRRKVLLDAHTHGVNIRGKLLFDYHAMPFTRVPLLEVPGEKLVLVREGYSEGGENPNGWSAGTMPYLMEYDNWGGLAVEDRDSYSREELAWRDWWGYDQIAWFANQSEESRNHFLEYTYKWTEINNPNAYFELPFRRMLGDGAVTGIRADNGEWDRQNFYQINWKSSDCPMGFSQEETAKRLWATGHELRKKAANPEMLIRYGAGEVYDEGTGMKLPEKIVVYGSFQPHVGAVKNDSNSEVTRMYYIGDNTYTLSVVMPFAGTYDYSVATYGTLSATYQEDRYPRSGSSNKAHFTTEKDNMAVRFQYRFITNEVTVEKFD